MGMHMYVAVKPFRIKFPEHLDISETDSFRSIYSPAGLALYIHTI